MPRPRTPTSQLVPGWDRKNPKRARARAQEPRPAGPLGFPPAQLRPAEKAIWAELEGMAPAKVLTNSDRWIVEIACKLMARMREHGIGGRDGLHVAEVAQLNTCLSKMGLTPVDRSRVSVPPHEEEANPFAQIAAEVGVSSKSVN